MKYLTPIVCLALAACGGYSGPTMGDIAPAKLLIDLSPDEMAYLNPKASACIASDNPFWPPDPFQPILTGPGFEECPGIIAKLKAQYEREKAQRNAEAIAAQTKAEAAELARRRAIIADP